MKNALKNKDVHNLRSEVRTEVSINASVEFTPGNSAMAYHFSLKNFSSKGFGILVRKESKVFDFIKTGDILTMKYHPDGPTANPAYYRTEIKHISEPEPGKNLDHMLVGLLILEDH